eukprot:TRINITY_DN5854_c0_g1_i1.p1 TRINITY_DN5854_c0_g1~~TRINITY_DN5854_c0_g1_i1.p1  ORF type:complete len:925 (+),score=228.54 TRINITY_DN5854_c0_g1_i1:137-2776(+)
MKEEEWLNNEENNQVKEPMQSFSTVEDEKAWISSLVDDSSLPAFKSSTVNVSFNSTHRNDANNNNTNPIDHYNNNNNDPSNMEVNMSFSREEKITNKELIGKEGEEEGEGKKGNSMEETLQTKQKSVSFANEMKKEYIIDSDALSIDSESEDEKDVPIHSNFNGNFTKFCSDSSDEEIDEMMESVKGMERGEGSGRNIELESDLSDDSDAHSDFEKKTQYYRNRISAPFPTRKEVVGRTSRNNDQVHAIRFTLQTTEHDTFSLSNPSMNFSSLSAHSKEVSLPPNHLPSPFEQLNLNGKKDQGEVEFEGLDFSLKSGNSTLVDQLYPRKIISNLNFNSSLRSDGEKRTAQVFPSASMSYSGVGASLKRTPLPPVRGDLNMSPMNFGVNSSIQETSIPLPDFSFQSGMNRSSASFSSSKNETRTSLLPDPIASLGAPIQSSYVPSKVLNGELWVDVPTYHNMEDEALLRHYTNISKGAQNSSQSRNEASDTYQSTDLRPEGKRKSILPNPSNMNLLPKDLKEDQKITNSTPPRQLKRYCQERNDLKDSSPQYRDINREFVSMKNIQRGANSKREDFHRDFECESSLHTIDESEGDTDASYLENSLQSRDLKSELEYPKNDLRGTKEFSRSSSQFRVAKSMKITLSSLPDNSDMLKLLLLRWARVPLRPLLPSKRRTTTVAEVLPAQPEFLAIEKLFGFENARIKVTRVTKFYNHSLLIHLMDQLDEGTENEDGDNVKLLFHFCEMGDQVLEYRTIHKVAKKGFGYYSQLKEEEGESIKNLLAGTSFTETQTLSQAFKQHQTRRRRKNNSLGRVLIVTAKLNEVIPWDDANENQMDINQNCCIRLPSNKLSPSTENELFLFLDHNRLVPNYLVDFCEKTNQ